MHYPEHIIQPLNENNSVFSFRPVVALVFSLCSGISEDLIMATKIYPRSYLRFIPWYRAYRGGGAITLGGKSWHSITLTENFFSDDHKKYPQTAYAKKNNCWMRLCAHEIGHIHHTQKYAWLFWYLIVFAFEYLRFGHQGSSLEAEADLAAKEYTKFNSYINFCIGPEALQKLLVSNLDAALKRKRILEWWNQYKNS